MCDFALETSNIPETVLRPALARMAPLQRDGLVRLEDGRITLPRAGHRFVRQVALCLDAHFTPGAQRHSAAV